MATTRSLQRKINRISQIEIFASGNLSNQPIIAIQAQIKILDEEWADYKASEDNYNETPEVIAMQETLETKYFSAKNKLILIELGMTKADAHVDIDTSMHELIVNQRSFLDQVTSLNHKGDNEVRLPRVNVPFFSGIYSEFASFRDLFEASIDKNPKISKVHKLQYY